MEPQSGEHSTEHHCPGPRLLAGEIKRT